MIQGLDILFIFPTVRTKNKFEIPLKPYIVNEYLDAIYATESEL